MPRTRPSFYVLKGHEAVPEPDVLRWARWLETSNEQRIVAQTEIPGGVVSTVFLGHDTTIGAGPPRLFETMVFIDGGDDERTQARCSTWAEAEEQHATILESYLQRHR